MKSSSRKEVEKKNLFEQVLLFFNALMEDLSENFFENHRKSDRICVIVCVYLSLENNFWRCIMRTGQWKTMGIGSLIGK